MGYVNEIRNEENELIGRYCSACNEELEYLDVTIEIWSTAHFGDLETIHIPSSDDCKNIEGYHCPHCAEEIRL